MSPKGAIQAAVVEIELLENLLSSVERETDVRNLCEKLIQKFGSVRNLFEESPEYLMAMNDIPDDIKIYLANIRKVIVHILRSDLEDMFFKDLFERRFDK